MNVILKVFLIDFGIFLGLFLLIFFTFVLIKALQNGKNHNITDDNIMSYCTRLFPIVAGKHIKSLIKWAILFFVIHLLVALFNAFQEYIATNVTYDKIPLLALFFDTLKNISPYVTPFLVPFLIILLIFIFGYGLIGTLYQISKNNSEQKKMASFADSVKKAEMKDAIIIDPETSENIVATVSDFEDGSSNNKKEIIPSENIEYSDDKNTYASNSKSEASSKNEKQYKPTKKEVASYFSENSQRALFGILKFLPKLLLIVLVLIGVNSIFLNVHDVTQVVEDLKTIKEYSTVVKNIQKSQAYTRVTCTNEEKKFNNSPIKTYRIDIIAEDGDVISSQEVTLTGRKIIIDSINVNFEFSEIESGKYSNISYPYRVYSETMAPVNGIELQCIYNSEKLPVMYCLENHDIYGIPEDTYYTRLGQLFNIIKDENRSKQMGIRTTIGNAIILSMSEDDVIDITVENDKGISARRHSSLFK